MHFLWKTCPQEAAIACFSIESMQITQVGLSLSVLLLVFEEDEEDGEEGIADDDDDDVELDDGIGIVLCGIVLCLLCLVSSS